MKCIVVEMIPELVLVLMAFVFAMIRCVETAVFVCLLCQD